MHVLQEGYILLNFELSVCGFVWITESGQKHTNNGVEEKGKNNPWSGELFWRRWKGALNSYVYMN